MYAIRSYYGPRQVELSIDSRAKMAGAVSGVDPDFPRTDCRAVQSSNSTYSAVVMDKKPRSLQRWVNDNGCCTHEKSDINIRHMPKGHDVGLKLSA